MLETFIMEVELDDDGGENTARVTVKGYGTVVIRRHADGLAVAVYGEQVPDEAVAECWAAVGDLALECTAADVVRRFEALNRRAVVVTDDLVAHYDDATRDWWVIEVEDVNTAGPDGWKVFEDDYSLWCGQVVGGKAVEDLGPVDKAIAQRVLERYRS